MYLCSVLRRGGIGELLLITNFVLGCSNPFLNVWFELCGAKSGEKEATPNGRAVLNEGLMEGGCHISVGTSGGWKADPISPHGITWLLWQTQITNTSKSQTEISVQNVQLLVRQKGLEFSFSRFYLCI